MFGLDQRFGHDGPRVHQVLAREEFALGELEGHAFGISAADIFFDDAGFIMGEAERFERSDAEGDGRLVAVADLEVDILAEQVESLTAVESADIEFGEREMRLNKIDDLFRGFVLHHAECDE